MTNPKVLTRPSFSKDLLQNIELLRKLGVPEGQFLKFVTGYDQTSGTQHDKFCGVVDTLCLIGDETWEAKCDIYRSFGFTDDEIVSMFKELPAVVGGYSKRRIRTVVGFFVDKLGCTPSELAVRPYLIMFSFEKWILPRCLVLRALESRISISCSTDLYQILAMPEDAFIEKFVIAHEDEVPEALSVYSGSKDFAMWSGTARKEILGHSWRFFK